MLVIDIEGYLQGEKNKIGEFARNTYGHMSKEDKL